MAKIRIEEVVEKLGMQVQAALKDSLKAVGHPEVNDREMFQAFKKNIRLRCQTWENVPDSSIDTGY